MGRFVKYIELYGADWKRPLDLYETLLPALGAPDWHGESNAALIDSMIYGGINSVHPPYIIRIRGARRWPPAVRAEVQMLVEQIEYHRGFLRRNYGKEADIQFELIP